MDANGTNKLAAAEADLATSMETFGYRSPQHLKAIRKYNRLYSQRAPSSSVDRSIRSNAAAANGVRKAGF